MRRLHAYLARLLPRRFQRHYRAEIEAMLSERRAELAGSSLGERTGFWANEIFDLLRTLGREWLRWLVPPRATRRRVPADPTVHLSLPERAIEMLHDTVGDVRFAARTLAKQPLFTVVVVLTLALGIGATTAVYTLVDSVLLRPLPFEDPGRLVFGVGSFPLNDSASVSPPDYLDYRDRATSFDSLAAFSSQTNPVAIGGGEAPAMASMRRATHELFSTLGVSPSRGRDFDPAEAREGGSPVAVISDGFWKRHFGADPEVVGAEILVDERPVTVVGVLPIGFELFGAPDLWMPLPFGADHMVVRRFHFLRVVGKLSAGVELRSAQSEIDAIAAELATAYPDSNTDWTMRLLPLHQATVGSVQQPLTLLLIAVGAVLVMVCCNVAVLLLARSTRRAQEIAVRNALGASSERIVRLLLSESFLLALAGGLLGAVVAYRGVDLLIGLSATTLPRADEIAVDGSVLVFSLVVTLGTGVLFGLVPAVRAARGEAVAALRDSGRTVAGGNQRLRSALVIGQVTLSFALLLGAGLMLRSFSALTAVEPGYDAQQLVSGFVSLPGARYESAEQRAAFFNALLDRLAGMSPVAGAAVVDIPPLAGGNDTFAYPEGSPPEPGTQGFNAQVRSVSAGYFDALGIPVESGRAFRSSDGAGAEPVIVLDAPFAEQMFPAGDAVGKRIVVDLGETRIARVVGVVGGVLHFGPAVGRYGTMYLPLEQRQVSSAAVVLRAASDSAAALAALRTGVEELDPMLPIAGASTFSERLAATVAGPRFRARLMLTFAIAALLLAAAGLYGVLGYFVAERRRDIGVRRALGADEAGVVRMVVGRGMRLVAVGLILGGVAAAALGWWIRSLLFGIGPADPLAFAAVALLLAAVALVACWLPARRAIKVDPLEALRAD